MLQLWSYHVSKVVHAEAVGMFAHGVLQIVHLYLLQVLLPHHSPPALLLLKKTKKNPNTIQIFFFIICTLRNLLGR